MKFDRITFDKNVLGGRACVRGLRITVSQILNLIANGMTIDEIIKNYPDLEKEDIKQALHYASSLVNEEICDLTGTHN